MYALVLVSVLALAHAAPQFRASSHHHHEHDSSLDDFMTDDIFDTGRFFNDLKKDMDELDAMIKELTDHFSTRGTSGLQGNQYKININLNGFVEKEITVKARAGIIMVQAVHKAEDGSERNYLDVRTLPSFVKTETGSWTYAGDLLKIVFDVQERGVTTEAEAEPTEEPDREEIENHDNHSNQDAEVGVRGDNDIDNEIPKKDTEVDVEATTYAVDFNNEVEFVPASLGRAQKVH